MASLLLASVEAKDIRYFGDENSYPVKLTRAIVSLHPAVDGNLITFNLDAFNFDQVIFGGEMVIEILLSGVCFGSQKFNLAASCPISGGDFMLNFCQVIPVDVTPGSYSFKLTMFNQDGRQLSSAAFDFTIP